MSRLSASWRTERLHITDGTLEDVPQLMHIFNACSHIEPWDPTFKIYPKEEFAGLVQQSLQDGLENGRFQLQLFHRNNQPIGYFHSYHHQPSQTFSSFLCLSYTPIIKKAATARS